MHVVAVVVAWNSAETLPACLDGLEAQDHADLEVVVVDNASDDATAAVLREALGRPRRHPLRVLDNPTNRGFAGGVNDAVRASDAAAVLLVNPDAIPAPDLTRRCVAVLEADPGCGSVQPRVHRTVASPDGTPVVDTTGHELTSARLVHNRGEGVPDRGQYRRPHQLFGVSGAVALHRRDMLDDVAWRLPDGSREVLTEDLFAFFEDVELDWRARLLGWTARYEPAATAVHERGGAGPRRTPAVEALNWANRLLVIATCDDRRALARALPLVVATTALKTIELAVTEPGALLPALRRLRLLRGCLWRRRQLMARARVPPDRVVARWTVPFRWRPWTATWWRRVAPR